MKKLTKIFTFTLALVTLMLFVAMPAHAALPEDTVAPLWVNTRLLTFGLTFPDDGYGYAEASIAAKAGTSKIVSDVYVYRQSGSSWIYVAEAHTTAYKNTSAVSCQFTPIEDTYYKAEFTFTVTKDGVDEVIERTDYKTY